MDGRLFNCAAPKPKARSLNRLQKNSKRCHSEARCVPRNLSSLAFKHRGIPHFVRNDNQWDFFRKLFSLCVFSLKQESKLPRLEADSVIGIPPVFSKLFDLS